MWRTSICGYMTRPRVIRVHHTVQREIVTQRTRTDSAIGEIVLPRSIGGQSEVVAIKQVDDLIIEYIDDSEVLGSLF